MEFKKYLKNYAERELELIGLMQSEFGVACLELLDKCADIARSDPESMKRICEILPKLIDCKPISPITEADFKIETHDSNVEILRCTRYPHLYRMPDGKYYDDRAIAYRRADSNENDRMYIYQTGNSSKQEVTLPYFPKEEIKILDQEYQEFINTDIEPDYEVE
jgi:hypothetical protein